jgi:hypothetical protein
VSDDECVINNGIAIPDGLRTHYLFILFLSFRAGKRSDDPLAVTGLEEPCGG